MTERSVRGRVAAVLLALAAPALADPAGQGRWEGVADLAGVPMPLVLDLAPGEAGAWVGSLTLPGRWIKGAPLGDVAAGAGELRMTLPPVLGERGAIALRPEGGRLVGEWRQGGHRTALVLVRSGPAQVDLPERGTPVAAALAGRWEGGYELGGQARQVTLTLANGAAGAPAQATLVIVGKRRSEVPIDLVAQSTRWLRVVSGEAGVALELRWPADDDVLRGQFVQGPLQADVVLRKVAP